MHYDVGNPDVIDYRYRNYQPYHLQPGDALALWTGLYGGVEHGVPNVTIDSAARMLEIDPDLRRTGSA